MQYIRENLWPESQQVLLAEAEISVSKVERRPQRSREREEIFAVTMSDIGRRKPGSSVETLYCSLRSSSSLLSRAMKFSCSMDKLGVGTFYWVESMDDTSITFFIHLVWYEVSSIVVIFAKIQEAFSKTCRNHSGYGNAEKMYRNVNHESILCCSEHPVIESHSPEGFSLLV